MTEDPSLTHRRGDPALDEPGTPRDTGHGYPSACEIRRIVAVAEALRIDPQFARIALQDETGRIPTDSDLRISVALAEKVLNSGRLVAKGRPGRRSAVRD